MRTFLRLAFLGSPSSIVRCLSMMCGGPRGFLHATRNCVSSTTTFFSHCSRASRFSSASRAALSLAFSAKTDSKRVAVALCPPAKRRRWLRASPGLFTKRLPSGGTHGSFRSSTRASDGASFGFASSTAVRLFTVLNDGRSSGGRRAARRRSSSISFSCMRSSSSRARAYFSSRARAASSFFTAATADMSCSRCRPSPTWFVSARRSGTWMRPRVSCASLYGGASAKPGSSSLLSSRYARA
mmetsp:Transcript_30773/g.95056  ORF Transcript_30773/g.95056 Transcript_30773/m.95056 type:complete len:241 (+) Transcript_30773:287-1009(+)